MKKLFFIVLFIFTAIPMLQAYEPGGSYKESAIEQLYQYGKALYERKDYVQAAQVFNRILRLDPHDIGALAYIEKIKNPKAPSLAYGITRSIVIDRAKKDINADIKNEIIAEDRIIRQLKEELVQLHTQPETVTHE